MQLHQVWRIVPNFGYPVAWDFWFFASAFRKQRRDSKHNKCLDTCLFCKKWFCKKIGEREKLSSAIRRVGWRNCKTFDRWFGRLCRAFWDQRTYLRNQYHGDGQGEWDAFLGHCVSNGMPGIREPGVHVFHLNGGLYWGRSVSKWGVPLLAARNCLLLHGPLKYW